MGTDGAWRWRKGVEDKYHYRFWGQVVRWMAYQRNMAKGETMRLYYVPDQPKMNQTLALHANVMERERRAAPQRRGHGADHGPVGQGRDGAVHARPATSGATSPAGSPPRSRASTRSRSSASRPGRRSETSFFVQGVAAERVGRPARPEVLEEIARVTAARSSRPASSTRSSGRWPSCPTRRRRSAGVQLWCHPVVGGGPDRAAGRLLGRTEGHRSCIMWISRDRRRRTILAR